LGSRAFFFLQKQGLTAQVRKALSEGSLLINSQREKPKKTSKKQLAQLRKKSSQTLLLFSWVTNVLRRKVNAFVAHS
jgi:hypothetical protein